MISTHTQLEAPSSVAYCLAGYMRAALRSFSIDYETQLLDKKSEKNTHQW
jgi:hypothetical protein